MIPNLCDLCESRLTANQAMYLHANGQKVRLHLKFLMVVSVILSKCVHQDETKIKYIPVDRSFNGNGFN